MGDNGRAVTTTLDLDPAPAPPPPGPRPPTLPRWTIVGFIVGGLAFLAIAVVASTIGSGNDDAGGTGPTGWSGTVLPEPARERPAFTLVDTDGQPFDFAAETAGRLTLVFFGYTNCPDVCPVHMATIAQALDRVDVPLDVVFVTTDPSRDDAERIRSWLGAFDPDFIGLTGELEAIEQAQEAMGTSVAIAEPAEPDGQYLVGHTSGVFVITPDDKVRLVYPFGTRQEDWVNDLPRIAANDQWRSPEAGAP
jgi:protein SCO1